MSLRLLTLVWERAPYKDGALLLLLALADFSNDDGVSWPAVETVAQKARMGDRHARRLLRKFEDDGILSTKDRGDLHLPNIYRISVPKLESYPTRTICPPSDEGGSGCPPKADMEVRKGGPDGRPTVKEPSKEPSIKRTEELPLIPMLLQTPEFIEVWNDWIVYRAERKMKVTPTTAKAQFAKLERWGPDKAVQALRDAMASNWQGFFEPKAGVSAFTAPPGGRPPLVPAMR